jgi:hypothetical protein
MFDKTVLAAARPRLPGRPEKPMNCFQRRYEQIATWTETAGGRGSKPSLPKVTDPLSVGPVSALKLINLRAVTFGLFNFGQREKASPIANRNRRQENKKAGLPRLFRHTTKENKSFSAAAHTNERPSTRDNLTRSPVLSQSPVLGTRPGGRATPSIARLGPGSVLRTLPGRGSAPAFSWPPGSSGPPVAGARG